MEQHQSGDSHFHALVHFGSKQRLGARGFDWRERHPNVQSVGRKREDWQRCNDYVAKDGRYHDIGVGRHAGQSVWGQVASADCREDALELIRAEKPRDFVLQRRNIDYFLDSLWPLQPTSSLFQPRPLEDFAIPDDINEWLLGNFL